MKWYEDNRRPEDRTNPNFSCGPEWLTKNFNRYDDEWYAKFEYLLGLDYFFNSCYLHDGDYVSGFQKLKADWNFLKRNLWYTWQKEWKEVKRPIQVLRRGLQGIALFLFVSFPLISHITYYIAKKKGKTKE